MKPDTTYRIWLKLLIRDAFFSGDRCGVNLLPDTATHQLLNKEGILFKQLSENSWGLITGSTPLDIDAETLRFQVKNQHHEFYFYAEALQSANPQCQVEDYGKNGIWKTLVIKLTPEIQNSTSETLVFDLTNQTKYLEYILVTNAETYSNPLQVKEERELVNFRSEERTQLPGTEKKVIRFVSTEPFPLKLSDPFRFHLWELRKSGENLLCELPGTPLVDKLSPFSPKDTITNYYYL